MTRQGFFIAIEGGDGTGKSTQVQILKDWLESTGHTVRVFRDPGTTATGEAIRSILLDQTDWHIGAVAEMFLFMAARAQLVEEAILPALARGEIVLQDRYLLSTVVYQGYAGGVPLTDVWAAGRLAIGSALPDLTFVLDLSPQLARERLQRPLDRMELKGKEYHDRVRDGFLACARLWRETFPTGEICVLDANRSAIELAKRIREEVEKFALQRK
ncbi:MAG: dTMP kinase [Planctomycetia bacterium]|nr:dTMP kinase [Planctomycetia bacterium]